jgi:hypothetical protein
VRTSEECDFSVKLLSIRWYCWTVYGSTAASPREQCAFKCVIGAVALVWASRLCRSSLRRNLRSAIVAQQFCPSAYAAGRHGKCSGPLGENQNKISRRVSPPLISATMQWLHRREGVQSIYLRQLSAPPLAAMTRSGVGCFTIESIWCCSSAGGPGASCALY